jgi:glutamate/tyrosine decarboxylase-like PLP-dependent enzyme
MSAAPLELSREEMRAYGYRVIDLLTDHFAGINQKRVGAKGPPAALRARFSGPAPEESSPFEEVLAGLERDVFPNIMNLIHPRFFAFVPGPANFVSVLADALASGFNVFNGSWLGGSGAAALELNVMDWIRAWCGFTEPAGGLFVSGGSVANLTALAAARHVRLQDRVEGAVVYFSDQTHSSVERALRVIGFAPEQMRKIASDAGFRLPLKELQTQIHADRAAGLRPFCVIANAGTTSTGAIDPLPEIADLCRRNDLWFHIDGAYGAAAVICDRGRALLRGLELADSLSLDPHKWLFQTIECGCVLVRDVQHLKSSFRIMPEYLKEIHRRTEEINPCDYGIQLTRGFRALKLWMSINVFGMDAFRAAVDRGFTLAELAEEIIRTKPGWKIVTPAQMAVVSFRIGENDQLVQQLVDAMIAEGYAFLTSTVLLGRPVLRFCTINPRTTEEDIEKTIEWLDKKSRDLLPAEM